MNFFGHAIVASWYDDEPFFVLGAMLPDFSGMLRLPPPQTSDTRVLAGVALHHATDAVFHQLPVFLKLMSDGRRALAAAGVARGSTRAVAHVGTEIILDEALARDGGGARAYLAALEKATSSPSASGWREPAALERFSALAMMLTERGVSLQACAPELVARRLKHVLARRPRLSLSDRDEDLVCDWVVAARPSVVGCASLIVTELRLRLGLHGLGVRSEPRA